MHNIEKNFGLIFKYMGIPEAEINQNVSFIRDFGFEEFQMTCLAYYISSYFKISMIEIDYSELETIESTMEFVRKKLTNIN